VQRFSAAQILHSAPFGFTFGSIGGGGGGCVELVVLAVLLLVALRKAASSASDCNFLNFGVAAISKSLSRVE